jgi:hypothetical protein
MKVNAIAIAAFIVCVLFAGSIMAADMGGELQRPMREAQPMHQRTEMIPGIHSADRLVGHTLVDREVNYIGSIDDLVISRDGRVEYLIIARDHLLGLRTDRVAVPWEAAKLQWDAADLLMTDLTEQQLEGAPTLDDYAQIGTQEFERQVHGYFGTAPRTGR